MQEPDFRKSLEFLRLLYSSGPWMLTAISVDKKKITAETFHGGEEERVLSWLDLHKTFNLYYSVNQPVETAYEKRKLAKTDVHSVHYLHVDVDPRAGEDVAAEQKRIIEQIERYHIKPTFIVFSGGGYNALWRLSKPIPVADGSPSPEETIARAIDVERRNWQFELDFETPDHCRDVSRILRLPGTLNRPNAEKVAKGRTVALARLHASRDQSYEYDFFMATPTVQSNVPSGGSKVTSDVERVESLDHVRGVGGHPIPDALKIVIAQGFDPSDPKKWEGDRSSALFWVVCELVRCGVPDPVIHGIITDARFEISASVLDKGTGVARYALRQISRAKDKADENGELLERMNAQYAVILEYGGGPVVMIEDGLSTGSSWDHEVIFQKFRSFKDRIKNYPKVPAGKKEVTAFDWWTAHRRRREYKRVVFEPGLDVPDCYNLWTGFAVQPVPGDKHLRYLDHVRANICNGDDEHYDYLIRWMARVVQQPRTQSMVAVVLLGERGTGKSIFGGFFGQVFGRHLFVASDVATLTGRFNGHLATSIFVIAEEAFDMKEKRHESVLKERITGQRTAVERKMVDIIQLPNYTHLLMTSNSERVIPAGDHERRFLVLRVGTAQRQNDNYFGKILEDQRSGGPSNLLHHLLNVDLSGWNVTQVPRTDELRLQQEHSMSHDLDWLLSKLTSGTWLDGKEKWIGPVRKKQLHENYKMHLTSLGSRFIKGERAFHNFLMKELKGTYDKQIYGEGNTDRPMAFFFPPLERCRELWDENRGYKSEWKKPVEEKVEDNVINLPGKVFE